MKTFVNTKQVPTFKPVELTITCESQEELDAIGALFNLATITDAMKAVFSVDLSRVWEGLKERGARELSTNAMRLRVEIDRSCTVRRVNGY